MLLCMNNRKTSCSPLSSRSSVLRTKSGVRAGSWAGGVGDALNIGSTSGGAGAGKIPFTQG